VVFHAVDVVRASTVISAKFDLICLFTAFYAFPDQEKALREMRTLARPTGKMVLFDYCSHAPDIGTILSRQENGAGWRPLIPGRLDAMFQANGWNVERKRDLSGHFARWYEDLVQRFDARRQEILQISSRQWFLFARAFYQKLLDLIRQGMLGGMLVIASPRQDF